MKNILYQKYYEMLYRHEAQIRMFKEIMAGNNNRVREDGFLALEEEHRRFLREMELFKMEVVLKYFEIL
jgi:hypothetical protein